MDIEAFSFDHRGSIVRYLNDQATEFEIGGQKDVAITLRAQASNVAIKMDIRDGREGIASPAQAIICQTVALFANGVSYQEVIAPTHGSKAVIRVRCAAMWVAKKRLGWSDEKFEKDFNRERSTICSGVAAAERRRQSDANFKRITDQLLDSNMRCANCQHPLVRV